MSLKKFICKGDKAMKKIVGAKEFKDRVTKKLKEVDINIKEDDLYFSQMLSGYYMTYRPCYPNESVADFVIYQDLNGSISVNGNLQALLHSIEKYEDLYDLERRL